MGKYVERAKELHKMGYNCAQAVAAAFSDVMGVDEKAALKMASAFGGGMAKMREVCGAVTGMFMAAGLIYGSDGLDDKAKNAVDYPRIQLLAGQFKSINGSLICRELLGLEGAVRTRPEGKNCHDMVADAAAILEAYLEEHPV